MIIEIWQSLKALKQLTVPSGTLRNGATAVSPVQNPEHIRGKWSITCRDDLNFLQVSPTNSFDLSVRSLTNNLRVRQTHNETILWLKGCAWLGRIPLRVKRALLSSGSHT